MDWMLIGIAGFVGGALNAVAGGGSFITLPALIFVGVPPVAANATGTAALLPGYIASAWRFRRDIELPAGLNFAGIALISVAGGSIGAVILLNTSEQVFSLLIPWLILLATAAFLAGPRLLRWGKASVEQATPESATPRSDGVKAGLVLFAVCVYGGYFNGGLGIILLAALGLLGQTNLHGMNGLKNAISALLTVVAVIVYASGGAIVGGHLLLLGGMAVVGGYAGAALAYRVSQPVLRGFVIAIGCLMALGFFLKDVS
ncbi:MAG: sulfite exporter TauE/SafE family protein [Desulfuromonadaceae bacterium]|nr:sulfite exporter TauE/SafE family protein [Desulfuromonadaceae bacterium]